MMHASHRATCRESNADLRFRETRRIVMRELHLKLGLAVMLGLILGAALFGPASGVAAPAAPLPDDMTEKELDQLQARVAMVAVDYHASNLWFAGKAENWPLAEYYWTQTLNHVRLSVEVKGTPDRDDQQGNQAALAKVVTAIENSPDMQVGAAIEKKDLRQFLVSYRSLLEGCYACHKAAGMPYLKPRVPVPPASSIITVDANAPWPQ
jgi:hypothetical protein